MTVRPIHPAEQQFLAGLSIPRSVVSMLDDERAICRARAAEGLLARHMGNWGYVLTTAGVQALADLGVDVFIPTEREPF